MLSDVRVKLVKIFSDNSLFLSFFFVLVDKETFKFVYTALRLSVVEILL